MIVTIHIVKEAKVFIELTLQLQQQLYQQQLQQQRQNSHEKLQSNQHQQQDQIFVDGPIIEEAIPEVATFPATTKTMEEKEDLKVNIRKPVFGTSHHVKHKGRCEKEGLNQDGTSINKYQGSIFCKDVADHSCANTQLGKVRVLQK
jgi:hypothetical protein